MEGNGLMLGNTLTGLLAALVITVATPSGELEIGIQGQKVTAALDKVPVPDDRIARDGNVVTVCGEGDRVLARVDLAPDRNAYVVVGGPKRLRIGVHTKEPDPALAEQLGIDAAESVVVTEVTDGMPAAEAGLRKHDVIVAIDGSAPGTQARLTGQLDRMKPGQTLTLRVLRRGERHDLVVEPRLVAEPESGHGALGELLAAQNLRLAHGGDALGALSLLSRARNNNLAEGLYGSRLARPDPAKPDGPEGEREDLAKQIGRLKDQLQRVEELLQDAETKKRK